MRSSRERGAVLVETALILSTALTLMLFTIDIGILGFMQVSADAASFFDAHENVIGMNSGTPETYTASLFPTIIKPGDMTTKVLDAPTPAVAVNYGYNPPAGQTPDPNSANNRHGGASMMQPVQLEVSVSPSPFFNIAGSNVGVSSQYIEPKWTECGPHYNVANENYACGDASAPPNSAVTYADAENTPPYYIGFNLVTHCEDPQPWGDTNNNYEASCQHPDYMALGVATFLDTSNWGITNPGVSGTTGSSVFEAAAFHQRVYSHIAQFFAANPDLFSLYNGYSSAVMKQLGITSLGAPSSGNFTSMANWQGFATVNAGVTGISPDPKGIDEAIQCVYDWDVIIQSGFPPGTYQKPGDAPLHPDQTCPSGVTLP